MIRTLRTCALLLAGAGSVRGVEPAAAICAEPRTERALAALYDAGSLRCHSPQGRAIEIPFGTIRRIVHDFTRPSEHSVAGPEGNRQRHYVFVFWLEQGVVRVAGYPLAPGRVKAFLSKLKGASGVDSETGPHLRLQQEVAQVPKSNRFVTHLDRRVRIGGITLGPGDFEMVLLENEAGLSRLYFKDLRLFTDRREIVLTIHLAATDDPYPHALFVYEDESVLVPRVREIRIRLRKIIPLDD